MDVPVKKLLIYPTMVLDVDGPVTITVLSGQAVVDIEPRAQTGGEK